MRLFASHTIRYCLILFHPGDRLQCHMSLKGEQLLFSWLHTVYVPFRITPILRLNVGSSCWKRRFYYVNVFVPHLKMWKNGLVYHPVLEWKNPKSIPCSGTKKLWKIVYCIVLYWRQRPYLCFTYLIKWFYHSTLVLPCLYKTVFNFLSLLSH